MTFCNELHLSACPHPLQGVTTDEGKTSGCLISACSDAAASTLTTRFSANKLHAGSWRPASSRKGHFTASQPVPAPAWYSATLTTTPSTASSITSRVPAPTCWLDPAGRWQDCPSSVWRQKMRTGEFPLFPGSEMSQWKSMVTVSCYPKAVWEQSRCESMDLFNLGITTWYELTIFPLSIDTFLNFPLFLSRWMAWQKLYLSNSSLGLSRCISQGLQLLWKQILASW